MKQKRSKYFIPFKKNSEIEGTLSKMLKGAFVSQESSGIYTWLQLGLLSLEKLIKIIDKYHNNVGAIKILVPMLQEASLWKKSGRFNEYGPEILKIQDRNKHDFIFGPTAEEVFTKLLTQFSLNKNIFPLNFYNIQWKFRDEIRPRFGIIRSREFLMKDAYTFHKDEECLLNTYQKMFYLYRDIFLELGLNPVTLKADTELMGGSLSHEFLIPSEFGETRISFSKKPSKKIKWEERNYTFEDKNGEKYIEIGHIYALGDKYSQTFKLKHPETKKPVQMGCYGIGVSRILGIMFEQKNLGPIAPFAITLITIGKTEKCKTMAEQIFNNHNDIIWDDRTNISAGEKFAEAELIGSPIQIIIGDKEAETNTITIKQTNWNSEEDNLENIDFNLLNKKNKSNL